MKGIRFLLLLPLLLFSCRNGESEALQVKIIPQRVFHAEIEQPEDSKAFMNEEFKVFWNAEDKISVFARNNLNGNYSFQGENGAKSGNFALVSEPDGQCTSLENYYAAYPYRESNSIVSGETVSMTLNIPSGQKWTAGSFDPEAQVMVAVSGSKSLQFRNVGSGICFQLTGNGVNVKSLSIKSNANEILAGTVTVIPGETPNTLTTEGSPTEITLTADTPVALDPQTPVRFWIMTCPALLSQGFTLTVRDDNGDVFEKKTIKEVPLQRNKLLLMSAVEVSMEAPAPTELGIYPDGGNAHIYNPDSEQISVYTAEGNVWVRFIDPEALRVVEVGPIPVSIVAGSTFTASVSEYVCGVRQSSTEYKMEVLSIDEGILTLMSGQSRFILRF